MNLRPFDTAGRRGRLFRRYQTSCVLSLSLLLAAGACLASGQTDPGRAELPLAEVRGVPSYGERAAVPEDPLVTQHREAARAYLEDNQYARALLELDRALRLSQGDAYECLLLLARAHRAVGHLGAARIAAEHAALYRPGDPAAHRLLGDLERQQDRLDGAVAHYRTATQADPANPHTTAAWYQLGQALEDGGWLLAAAQAYEQFDHAAWEGQPQHRTDPEVAPLLAQHPHGLIARRLELLGRLNRTDAQVAAARRAFEIRPAEPYLQRLVARTLLDAGRPGEAFEFCQARLAPPASQPSTPTMEVPVLLTLAVEAARAAGRLDPWVEELRAAVAAGAEPGLALRVAQTLGAAGAPAAAVPLWRALAAARPESTELTWSLAASLKDAGDLAGALDALETFVRRNPAAADVPAGGLEEWMRSFAATDQFLRLVAERTARSECDEATFTILGATAAAGGQLDLAEQLLAAALERRPDFALAHIVWARLLVTQHRWEEAQAHARQALAAAPAATAAQLVLGDALAGLDENDAAEAAYKAAVERRPDDLDAVQALARHYQRTGNLLAAQRWLQQAWALDRTRPEPIEDLIEAYLAAGKTDLAQTALAQAEAADLPPDPLRRMRTTLRFVGAMLQEEHLAELRRQFTEHPDDFRTGLKLAVGLHLAQRPDEALAVLERLPPGGPDDEQAQYLRARVHLQLLEPEAAITIVSQLAQRYPRRVGTLKLLAECCLTDFRLDEARAALRRILALDLPPAAQIEQRLQLLATYVDFMEYDAAEQLIDEWLAETPATRPAPPAASDEQSAQAANPADVWMQARLRLLLLAGRNEEAVACATTRLAAASARFDELTAAYREFAGTLQEPPTGVERQMELKRHERDLTAALQDLLARRGEFVEVCVDAGQPALAEREVRAWLAVQPDQPQVQEWLVTVLLEAGRPDDALQFVGTLVPRTETDAVRVLLLRARALAAAGRTQDALKDFATLQSNALASASAALGLQIRQEMLSTLIRAREYSQAVRLCDEWLEHAGAESAARFALLSLKRFVLQAAEREEDHIAVAEELLQLRPHDPGLNNDLGYTWVDRGENLARATEMIRRAVAAEPLNAAYLDSLGWAFYKQGDFGAARLQLARAVRLQEGQDPTLHDHLGDAEYRLGDRAAARARWEKALELAEAEIERSAGDVPAADRPPGRTALIASLRGKIAALDAGAAPAVAPVVGPQ